MFLKSALSILFLCSAGAAEKPQEVSICDLRRVAEKVEGKVIRVRGLLRNSETRKNPFYDELVPQTCKEPDDRRLVFHVVSPDVHDLANPPSGYEPDMESVRQAERIFRIAARNDRTVSAVIEGVYRSTSEEKAQSSRHKQYSGVIIVQAIRDAKVR